MKTAPLVVAVITASVLPAALSSFGCNKTEDAPPAPSATAAVVAPPPTAAAPAVTAIAPVQPTVVPAKPTVPRTAADGAAPAARADAAPPPVVGLPPGFPTIALPHPSALPGMAASVVGGIIQNLPPPIIPSPNPTQ